MNDKTPVTKHLIDEAALAAAVTALKADLQDDGGAKTVRRLRTVLWVGGALSLFASFGTQTPLPWGLWAFVLTIGAVQSLVLELMKRHAKRGGSRAILAGSVGALAVCFIAVGYAILTVPWAVGAVGIGCLWGWWTNRMDRYPGELLWTPGGEDLRFHDAGGTIDDSDALAVIIAPYAGRREAIDAAAKVLRELGDLAAVLAWLPNSREAPGRVVLNKLSDDERNLLALALRVREAGRTITPPAPPAPLPPAPPA